MSGRNISHNREEQRLETLSFLLLVAGGVAGLVSMPRVVPFGDGFEMVALAKNLAIHGTFADPFEVLKTGFTAANPPLYPFLLSLLIRIVGAGQLALLAVSVCTIVTNAVIASLLPRLSIVFYRNMWPGVGAAILWLVIAQPMPAWDANLTLCLLELFVLQTNSTVGRNNSILHGMVSGLLAGALFLLNPSTILIFLPWLIFLGFSGRYQIKRCVGHCAIILALLAVIASSWAIRNKRLLGAYVIRTNLGMTLYSSDNDCAHASMIANEANNCYQAHHPNTSIDEAELLKKMGEVAYDHMRTSDAIRWIASHPQRFTALTLERALEFWFPRIDEHPWKIAVLWLATLLSVPGMIVMAKNRLPVMLYVGFVLFLYPLIYYIVVSDVRYRYPVIWLTLLPAGFLCYLLANRVAPQLMSRLSR